MKKNSLALNIFLTVIMICGLFIPAGFAEAATLRLEIDGSTSTPWNIGNIKPGAGGSQTVILKNTGDLAGILKIWIGNLSNQEGSNPESETGDLAEPGELGQFLELKVDCASPGTNLDVPIILNHFPRSVSDTFFIGLDRINAGETVTLLWQWRLPLDTDNSAQGDRVSFDVYYYIEEIPSIPPEPVPEPPVVKPPVTIAPTIIRVVSFGDKSESGDAPEDEENMAVQSDRTLENTYTVNLLTDKVTMTFDIGTEVLTTDSSAVPERIEVHVDAERMPPLPEGYAILSPLYTIDAVTKEDKIESVSFDPPIRLGLNYTTADLPPGVSVSDIFIAYYDFDTEQWVQLDGPPGFVAEAGEAVAVVAHLTPFIVLARVNLANIVPARFRVDSLTVTPEQVSVGERVLVRAHVYNFGGLAGEYIARLSLDGQVIKSQIVALSPGRDRNISFGLVLDKVGHYEVTIANLKGSFDVLPGSGPSFGIDIFTVVEWILIIAGIAGALYLVFRLRRDRPGRKTK